MRATVIRKAHFNAAHRLHNPNWSDEKNREYFGKCNNPNYHGHNYEFYVKLSGEVQSETGYVYDMKALADIVEEHVCERFDHKNLNLDVDDFKNLNPTAENICIVIWNILRTQISTEFDLSVILYETERNIVEYHGS